jgi:hypothetical protein
VRPRGKEVELVAAEFNGELAKVSGIAKIKTLAALAAAVSLDFSDQEEFISLQDERVVKHGFLREKR